MGFRLGKEVFEGRGVAGAAQVGNVEGSDSAYLRE